MTNKDFNDAIDRAITMINERKESMSVAQYYDILLPIQSLKIPEPKHGAYCQWCGKSYKELGGVHHLCNVQVHEPKENIHPNEWFRVDGVWHHFIRYDDKWYIDGEEYKYIGNSNSRVAERYNSGEPEEEEEKDIILEVWEKIKYDEFLEEDTKTIRLNSCTYDYIKKMKQAIEKYAKSKGGK